MSRKALYVIAFVLIAAGGGLYLYRREHARPAVSFVTAPVARGHIEAKVTATGTVSPLVTVLVGSQISGRVNALFADYNSPVKKGQIIAKLDTSLLDASVEQARAGLLAAEGNLAKARAQALDAGRQATRANELAGKKLVAQADSDTAEANQAAADAGVKAAEGQVELSKAALDQARINLKFATIYSPINGIVISRSVDVGQTVAASLSAPTLYTIAEDLGKMQVDTSVSESDVGKITAGMDALFTVDAYPGERFQGKVRQIRNAPVSVQNVVTYDAVVDVPNPDLKLKPGMTANVSFVYAQRDAVLKIPSASLRFQPPDELLGKVDDELKAGGKGARRGKPGANEARPVWLLRGEAMVPVRAMIHVGVSDGSSVEAIDGLSEGEQVITEIVDVDTTKKPAATPSGGGGGRRGGF